ncbi:SCO family protein [Roseomonas elaeocarpi]|uniref:SCO family protein n=1 Tax=Roseomonas elaeocarpi TaxID=907779 RepID=A0ABV6JPE0_9PROT
MMRALRILVAVLFLALVAGWGWAWFARAPGESWPLAFARVLTGRAAPQPVSADAVALPPGVSLGGPFALVNQDGQAVTDRSYRGKAVLIFFGYTFCPDVCPTELSVMAAAIDQLGPLASRVQPVLITIDPERDTPAKLKDYVALFHPSIQGLTGTAEQIAAVAKEYRVYYARSDAPEASDYLMDHSGFTYLLGPDGQFRAMFRPGVPPESLAEAVRRVLG